MVRFSDFARKTNHILLFCERSEREKENLSVRPQKRESALTNSLLSFYRV
ncbi:MAG: hypothetical protein U5L45_03340 [Saprospiraceae bacterium]|nr:hypothetical protein [Saprospiraceae bacterium]